MLRVFNAALRTYPIVIHNPFKFRLWDAIVDISMRQSNADDDSRATVITFNNSPERTLLQKNLAAINVVPIIMGGTISEWSNLLKIELTAIALERVRTPYVMGCDAFDVCFLSPISEAVNRFLKSGKRMLFNATYVNWPPSKSYRKIEMEMHPGEMFCYLNSGAWIAETDYAKMVFELAMSLRSSDAIRHEIAQLVCGRPDRHRFLIENSDQMVIRPLFHKLYPQLDIDSRCELFQVLQDEPNEWRKHALRIGDIVSLVED